MTYTGISSDQYFGRGGYDPQAAAEAKSRLQNFSGASAISSNAYYGHPEDDEEDSLAQEGGLLGELGQNETVAQLERGIRDMAGRLMANPEVQNFGDSLRTGALKVSRCLTDGATPEIDLMPFPFYSAWRLPSADVGTTLKPC